MNMYVGRCRYVHVAVALKYTCSCRVVCGMMTTLGAEVICGRVPGLTTRQREMCRTLPDAMVAVGDGIRLATDECRYQFRHHRWNCTAISNPNSFGHVVIVGEFFLLSSL